MINSFTETLFWNLSCSYLRRIDRRLLTSQCEESQYHRLAPVVPSSTAFPATAPDWAPYPIASFAFSCRSHLRSSESFRNWQRSRAKFLHTSPFLCGYVLLICFICLRVDCTKENTMLAFRIETAKNKFILK